MDKHLPSILTSLNYILISLNLSVNSRTFTYYYELFCFNSLLNIFSSTKVSLLFFVVVLLRSISWMNPYFDFIFIFMDYMKYNFTKQREKQPCSLHIAFNFENMLKDTNKKHSRCTKKNQRTEGKKARTIIIWLFFKSGLWSFGYI